MKKYAILLLSLLTLTTCESDDPIQYKLSTQVNPPEGGTISPSSGTFDEGEEIIQKGVEAALEHYDQLITVKQKQSKAKDGFQK